MLAARPGFTAIVVLTLSLGIGAVTAMFSIVNGVLLRPLPYQEPERLVRIHTQRSGRSFGSISNWEYLDLLESTQSFRDIGLYRFTDVNLFDGDGEPEHLLGVRIVPGVLDALGIAPALGRALESEEGWAGNHRVALISDRLWKRRFGSDPEVIGQSLRVLNDRFEIVGVMSEGFEFPREDIEVWAGYGLDRVNPGDRGTHSANIIARLRQGVSVEQAQSELEFLSRRLRQDYPENYAENSGFHFVVQPYLDNVAGAVRPALLVLMGAVGFVLLIACVNVSNLLLVRITGREKEIAIRASLGAGQGRIVSQMLTESLLFAVLGGLGALVVAKGAFRALVLLHPESLPRLGEVALDGSVLLFNLGLVVFTTVVVGVIPSLRISRMTMPEKLKDGGREGASGVGGH
jgi:predicted permease